MNILIVLHEATRTGAPLVGGLIAAAIKKYWDVRVLCLVDGPLVAWLRERVGAKRVGVLSAWKSSEDRWKASFLDRVAVARNYLEDDGSKVVYVNSLAASEFAVAAKACKRRVFIHSHEKIGEIRNLLAGRSTTLDIFSYCDGVVLAADDLGDDLSTVFGVVPRPMFNFGVAVDAEEIISMSKTGSLTAFTASRKPFEPNERVVVGMSGHASPRKGADIFFDTAEAIPEHDFIWIGKWDPAEAPENKKLYRRFQSKRLDNFYVSGLVENPHRCTSELDLFFLSSREDPNPLVVAEAMVLGVPVLCFSTSTAVHDFMGRTGIMLFGEPNATDAVRLIKLLKKSGPRSLKSQMGIDRNMVRQRFDLMGKSARLTDFIKSVSENCSV